MAKSSTLLAACVAASAALFAESADAQSAEQYTAQCIRATHAPGQYTIQLGGVIPQVVAGAGGSARGVHDVNDCLADKYQLQPGQRAVAVSAAPAQTIDTSRSNCNRILNRSPGTAAAAAFGSTLLLGAIGASVQAGVYQRNLQACLARYGTVGGAAPAAFGCGRGEAMVGGTRYCRGG